MAQRTKDLEREIAEKEFSKKEAVLAEEDWARTFNAVPAQIAILVFLANMKSSLPHLSYHWNSIIDELDLE